MIRNERAAGDSRHARTGKDGAFYSEDGVLLATVDTFTSNVNYNNAKYSVLITNILCKFLTALVVLL